MVLTTIQFLFLYLFLHSSATVGSPQSNTSVKPEELRNWVSFLASDDMKGRRNGSPEMLKAATWLETKFKEFGLVPVLKNGSFLQEYSFTSRQQTISERNVIGMIPGNDPGLKDQYIIISAHFDHIGISRGGLADSINNGADDNAAGTCTLLGIAKTIKEKQINPGRSIIFAVFSGEEAGMRGSRYFVSNSPVNPSNIYADLNFEMTGHSEFFGKKRYYMTGCKVSDLDDIISIYNRQSDWKLIDTIPMADMLFTASDNISFSRVSNSNNISNGIPSGTFATATSPAYLHRPSDESGLLDYSNMSDLVKYFSDLTIWLSGYKMNIEFTDKGYKRLKE
jgi:Zn-dependent M28 family amino/carboxypeptidase